MKGLSLSLAFSLIFVHDWLFALGHGVFPRHTLVPVFQHVVHSCCNYQGLLNVFEGGVAGAKGKWS